MNFSNLYIFWIVFCYKVSQYCIAATVTPTLVLYTTQYTVDDKPGQVKLSTTEGHTNQYSSESFKESKMANIVLSTSDLTSEFNLSFFNNVTSTLALLFINTSNTIPFLSASSSSFHVNLSMVKPSTTIVSSSSFNVDVNQDINTVTPFSSSVELGIYINRTIDSLSTTKTSLTDSKWTSTTQSSHTDSTWGAVTMLTSSATESVVTNVPLTSYLVSPSPPLYHTPLRRPTNTTHDNTKCNQILQQIPDKAHITELDNDIVLFSVVHGNTINISSGVIYPENIAFTLYKHFKMDSINNYTKYLRLQKAIDIEQIYFDTKTVINYIILRIACAENQSFSWKTINITIEDVDDNGPTFDNSGDATCALPVYKAGTGEKFIGVLYLSPGAIHAVDGDLTKTNNISYSFLHGSPVNYQAYFIIDYSSGSVNKTSNITDTDPHEFVIIVQATEDSPIKRSSVAVLTVSVAPPYIPPQSSPYRANKTVLMVLQILSVVVILGFTVGFAYIVHHRNKKRKVYCTNDQVDKIESIDDIEEYMIATSTNEVTTCVQPALVLPETSTLSVPSPDLVPTTSLSPVSTRKVKFVLPEKTYRMIYGTRGRLARRN